MKIQSENNLDIFIEADIIFSMNNFASIVEKISEHDPNTAEGVQSIFDTLFMISSKIVLNINKNFYETKDDILEAVEHIPFEDYSSMVRQIRTLLLQNSKSDSDYTDTILASLESYSIIVNLTKFTNDDNKKDIIIANGEEYINLSIILNMLNPSLYQDIIKYAFENKLNRKDYVVYFSTQAFPYIYQYIELTTREEKIAKDGSTISSGIHKNLDLAALARESESVSTLSEEEEMLTNEYIKTQEKMMNDVEYQKILKKIPQR